MQQASLLLALLEKALIKHLCDGDYSKLGSEVTHLDVLSALCGPQLAAEMHSHDQVESAKIWQAIKSACKNEQNLIYASTGTERSLQELKQLTGRILLVENCMEFAIAGGAAGQRSN